MREGPRAKHGILGVFAWGGGGGGTLLRAKAPLENPPGLVSNLTPLTVAVGPSSNIMFCDDQPGNPFPTLRTTELRRLIWAVPVAATKPPIISADAFSK